MNHKSLYIFCVALFLTVSAQSQEQTESPVHRMSTQIINPRNYPDDYRRYVKPPSFEQFGNKVHFTIMRGFQMRNDSLINVAQDLDFNTKKHDLGDFIWPNAHFLSAKNIPDMVAEVKKRNLYLYQIWGYVPGSGEGDWKQYEFDKKTSDLFQKELGERWLGMDMGEQDGRYLMAYSDQLYPSSANRQEQYLWFHRHMNKISNDMRNKMATLTAVNYAHYLVKEGYYTMVGSEAAQMHPNSQVFYAFNRGAGKQYGLPWFGNASIYNRFGWKTYTDKGADFGPTKGTSLMLLKRLLYSHILYNSLVAGFESGWYMKDPKKVANKTKSDDKNSDLILSPVGKIQYYAKKFTEQNPDLGVMQTPVAVLQDFYSGWIFPNYNHLLYRVWGGLPYDRADYYTNNLFGMFYTDYQESSYFHDERGFNSATPYGDAVDALLSDAPEFVMERYPIIVVAGELKGGREITDKLSAYVNNGGRLVITSASLANLSDDFAGIGVNGFINMPQGSQIEIKGGATIKETNQMRIARLQLPATAQILAASGEYPLAAKLQMGKGSVIVFASDFGVGTQKEYDGVIKRTIDQPLVNPFPMLSHVHKILDDIFKQVRIFDAGEDLSVIVCRKKGGEYTVGIANNELKEKPFKIKSFVGDITSISEYKLDESEKGAVGQLPEGFENSAVGKNTKSTIAAGDIRIFKVMVNEQNVTEIQEAKQTPKPQGKLLPLGNVTSVVREILLRPTFFQHYDGVVVDWKYVAEKEADALAEEKHWLNLQKCNVVVDLTSGINLFPDLRLVNNIESEYQTSIKKISSVINKMPSLGAKDLIITLHRSVENNISMEDTWKNFETTVKNICQLAAQKGVTVHLRMIHTKMPNSLDQAIEFISRVNADNLKLSPSISALVGAKISAKTLSDKAKDKIGILLISSPEYDLTGKMWNQQGTLKHTQYAREIADYIKIAPNSLKLIDTNNQSQDDEYINSKAYDEISSIK